MPPAGHPCPELLAALELPPLTPPHCRHWHLAYSGGGDSSLLLRLLATLRQRYQVGLTAHHIDHGLHPASADWAEQCRQRCAALDVPFHSLRVGVDPRQGGVEAAARRARYAALRPLVASDEALITAHHRDDQVETLLLQLMRGAGPRGLAAMAPLMPFGNGTLQRPLLPFDRAALDRCRELLGVEAIEDPSNSDLRFDRNYLRHQVLPLLRRRWPQLNGTVARSATLLAEAEGVIQTQAELDLQRAATGRRDALAIGPLRSLPAARRHNALRHWIGRLRLPLPPLERLLEIDRTVLTAAADRQPLVVWRGAELRRHRERLYLIDPGQRPSPLADCAWMVSAGPLTLPDGRRLKVAAAAAPALDRRLLEGGRVVVRAIRPDERVALAGEQRSRRLARYLQEAAIPPWDRQQLIAIEAGGELLTVVGVGVATDALTWEREQSVEVVLAGSAPDE